jgi:hypothetical protein
MATACGATRGRMCILFMGRVGMADPFWSRMARELLI